MVPGANVDPKVIDVYWVVIRFDGVGNQLARDANEHSISEFCFGFLFPTL